jgi:MFS superfamily sulfate permease-like transporter
LLSVLILGTLPGLIIAFLLTAVEVVRRAATPQTAVLKTGPDGSEFAALTGIDQGTTAPGVVVYRFGGPLFFANAHLLSENIEAIAAAHPGELKWIVLDAETINDIDTTGAEALKRTVENLRQKGIGFAISRAHAPVRDLLETYELLELIGEQRMYHTNRAAVRALLGND